MRKHLLPPLLALLFFAGCDENAGKVPLPAEQPPLPVETVTVHKRKIPIWAEFTGMTKASSEQEVRARVSGRLEKRYFKDGDMVEKGQKLFLIEQTQYRADLEAAEAGKARDVASLNLAKANVERYKPLVKEGLAPRATLEEYEAQYAQFKAAILADEARIREAKLKLGYTVVTAPVDGKTSARRVDVGNLVGYGEPTLLTTVLRINPLYVYFAPAEGTVRMIQTYRSRDRLPARFTVPSNNDRLTRESLHGYVDFTDNTADPSTSTITMRATLENDRFEVLPGTFGYVDVFITDSIPFILLPPQVVFEDQEGKFVYTVGKDGKAVRTGVKVGFSSRHYVQIESGLAEGDRVVVSGLMKIHAGTPLEAKDATDSRGVYAVLKKNRLLPEAD